MKASLGRLPKGNLLSPPAIVISLQGPLVGLYWTRPLGSGRGKEQGVESLAMNPMSVYLLLGTYCGSHYS